MSVRGFIQNKLNGLGVYKIEPQYKKMIATYRWLQRQMQVLFDNSTFEMYLRRDGFTLEGHRDYEDRVIKADISWNIERAQRGVAASSGFLDFYERLIAWCEEYNESLVPSLTYLDPDSESGPTLGDLADEPT